MAACDNLGAVLFFSMFLCRLRHLICIGFLAALAAHPGHAAPPTVAAAADLKFALTSIAARYERETGQSVRLTFGSSGVFTRQIEQGAPFELFMSADEAYVFRLADAKLTRDRGVPYAVGRLVWFMPTATPPSLRVSTDVAKLEANLGTVLRAKGLRHVAIANPEHAPYGRAARAVMLHLGVWEHVLPRLVLGENAAQAMQFASSGASDGGIVPLALARAPEATALGTWVSIPAAWHQNEPLRQRMVLTHKAGPEATAFYAWLQTPPVREMLVAHGFALPDDTATQAGR